MKQITFIALQMKT